MTAVLNGAHFPSGAAVVIGGSGGIGRVICERLAEHGTDVALTYRSNADAAAEAVEVIQRAGRRALSVPVDLCDAAEVAAFFAEVAKSFGRVHTTVWAAGAEIPLVHTSQIETADLGRVIDEELIAFYNVVKTAVPQMRSEGGALVALTTAGLRRHPPRDILSTLPKAGIEAVVRGLAREEGRFGIRANSVALGVIDAGHFHKLEPYLTPEFVQAMKDNTVVRRLGTPREAADAVVFLASSASSYTTGQSLTVDGGYSV